MLVKRVVWNFIVFAKTAMSQKKFFQREKIFKIDIFVLNHVLNHSKSIPTKKNFSKIFRFFGHQFFEKKTAMSQKKCFQREEIFKIEIFILKYVFNHSESIPNKKMFSKNFENFRFFWSFLG